MRTLSSAPSVRFHSNFGVFLAFLLSLVLVTFPPSLYSQAFAGINGTVTDATGAVIPDASVAVTNNATGVISRTVTASAGTYTVTGLNPGTYAVKIDKTGFQTAVINGVLVEVARKSTADVVLQPGSVQSTIEVTSSALTLQTDQPQLATTVEPQLVAELPNEFGNDIGARGRQIDNFIVLTPGVTGNSFSHRINGGVDFQNEIVFNGIPVAQSETQGLQTNINPPYELVGQFGVLNSVFSAQYGLGQGVAQYQFSSGTNALHGDAFEILRNDYFDAPGVNPNTPGRPNPDKEHNFGFSFGGPVYLPHIYDGRNKTFFYVSLEWYRLKSSVSGTMTMPTAAEKGGDFSAVGNNIYVPSNFVPPAGCNVTPGTQFPGNLIPSACVSAASKAILPVLPDPNLAGLTNNLQSQVTSTSTKQASWGFNIDHNLTQAQTLHFTFWRDSYNQPNCCDNHALFAATSPLSGMKQEPRLGTGVFLTYSNTLTNHLVMTAGMGWMGEINNELNVHPGYTFPGITGGTVFPRIDFGCGGNSNCNSPQKPNDLGAGNGGESFSDNRKLGLSWSNNFLYTHGRHTFNFGWEARRTYQDDQECQYCTGRINFSFLTTSRASDQGSGNSFASFLLGEVDSVDRRFAIEQKLRNFYFAPYVQDNIKITPKLTVDAGIRWDIMRPFTENGNNIVFFQSNLPNSAAIDPATGQPLLGALSKFGNCSAGCAGADHGSIDWHQFSPRIGLTYALTSKTVLLAGLALNHLDGGMFEYGTNKVAVSFGNLLAGVVQVPSTNSTNPGYGSWDANPVSSPGLTAFSPTMGNGSNVNVLALKNGRAPYNEAWDFGVQRELPWNMFVSASYVGNRGIHLPSQLNPYNQLSPSLLSLCTPGAADCVLGLPFTDPAAQTVLAADGFGQCAGMFMPYCNFATDFPSGTLQRALLPYPQFSSIFNNFETSGSSLYNALQTQVQKRFRSGVSFLVNYTLSRMMSNTNSGFTSFASTALNKFDQKSEWTIDNNDQTHIINVSGVYELPIGPGKPFLSSGGKLAKNLIGGWQVSGILSYSTGSPNGPNTIRANGDPLGSGAGNRANIVAGVPISVNWNNYHRGAPVFTTAAFSDPGNWTLGNSARVIGALRNPFNKNENIGLGKHFYFGEKVSAELRMEFFNIFNRAQICGFGNTDTNVSDGAGAFGYDNISSPGVPAPCQGNTPRHGQAFFKVTF